MPEMTSNPPTDDLVSRVNKHLNEAAGASSQWRSDAADDYDYYAGRQWELDDLAVLEELRKPALTFNRVGPHVDAICGFEVANRQEARLKPRSNEDSGVAEVLTGAVKYFREQCDAEDEDSEAFQDSVITGLGCTETRLEYAGDLDGMAIVARVDGLAEMYWDPNASKANLSDARWLARCRRVPDDEFKEKWPGKFDDVVQSGVALGVETHTSVIPSKRYRFTENITYDAEAHTVLVIEYQWMEEKKVTRVVNPANGKIETLDKAKFDKIKPIIEELNVPYVNMTRNIYKRVFIAGNTILDGPYDLPVQVGFTYKFICNKRDRNTNSWFGLVRALRDPQKWANKWLSQVLHIMNSNAKGGLLVEETAVQDIEEFEDKFAASDSVLWLNEGGISKVGPKPNSGYPQGFERLMEFAMNVMPLVSGLNLELMGMVSREQPGVLEYQRKQAAMVILASLFGHLRRYRKEQCRLMVEFIQRYLSDGRFIRITGPEGEQYVQLALKTPDLSYDVIIDDAPTSPDQRDRVWQMLVQALPFIAKMGMPIPPDILDYMPLPATLAEKWKGQVRQMQQGGGQKSDPEAEAKAAKTQQDAQIAAQKGQQELQQGQQRHQAMMAEHMGHVQKGQAEVEKARAEADAAQARARVVPIQAMLEERRKQQLNQERLAQMRRKE